MAKDPAFLFYPGDFIVGTQFFTDEQVGKYIRLLMAQHQHGHLSENQVIMICKSYDNEVMSKFIRDKEGKWYNERLDTEIDRRKKFTESRSNNRKGKKNISKSYDLHMETENETIIINKEDKLLQSISIKEGKSEIMLPDSKAKEAIRLYYQRNYVLISEGDVHRMFDAFKIQRVGSKKNFYQHESDVLDHFFNWLPGQKFELQNAVTPVKRMQL